MKCSAVFLEKELLLVQLIEADFHLYLMKCSYQTGKDIIRFLKLS